MRALVIQEEELVVGGLVPPPISLYTDHRIALVTSQGSGLVFASFGVGFCFGGWLSTQEWAQPTVRAVYDPIFSTYDDAVALTTDLLEQVFSD